MRRGDLFFAFRDKNEIDRKLASRAADGMKCGEERGFRPFLVHGAAADNHFAETGLVHQRSLEWRRRPLGRARLLDVVHEIQAERARSACVERGEDPGLAVGWHLRDLAETRLAKEPHHQIATLGYAADLRGDRRLTDPLLE